MSNFETEPTASVAGIEKNCARLEAANRVWAELECGFGAPRNNTFDTPYNIGCTSCALIVRVYPDGPASFEFANPIPESTSSTNEGDEETPQESQDCINTPGTVKGAAIAETQVSIERRMVELDARRRQQQQQNK